MPLPPGRCEPEGYRGSTRSSLSGGRCSQVPQMGRYAVLILRRCRRSTRFAAPGAGTMVTGNRYTARKGFKPAGQTAQPAARMARLSNCWRRPSRAESATSPLRTLPSVEKWEPAAKTSEKSCQVGAEAVKTGDESIRSRRGSPRGPAGARGGAELSASASRAPGADHGF